MMDVKVSKDKNSRWVDWENLMLGETESITIHKDKEGEFSRDKSSAKWSPSFTKPARPCISELESFQIKVR